MSIAFDRVAADDPRAARLLDAYFDERARTWPSKERAYQRKPAPVADFADGNGVFLVATIDGEDAGCGALRSLGGGRFEVKHLFVAPAGRGRGTGGAILAALEDAARELGAVEVVLDTNRSLEAAGGLYASRGYRAIEPYNDNPNATDWYGKPLTPGV